MEYKSLYNKIIENAQKDLANRHDGYYEKHHIIPKSLGGNNDENNLVKLTPREHFICHWLLVKMYRKGSEERNKMLYAFWFMKSNPNNNNQRYINSRAYEKYRIEYSKLVSKQMSIRQIGSNNSQFGFKWYTNRNTGECKKFKEKPDIFWIEGRNLFRNESDIIPHIKKYIKGLNKTKLLWDNFHKNNFNSLNEYAKSLHISQPTLSLNFRKYISLYNKICSRGFDLKSNKDLVGVYR